MLIVFGLFIYNHYAGGGNNSIDKVEQLRVETKHNIKETKKELKENIKGEKKDEDKGKGDDKDGKKKKDKE